MQNAVTRTTFISSVNFNLFSFWVYSGKTGHPYPHSSSISFSTFLLISSGDLAAPSFL
jgi:hypothetical protein